MNYLLSDKAKNVLSVIGDKNPDGSLLDTKQMTECVNYKVSREAITFTVRYMEQKGLVEKAGKEIRRNRARQTFKLTEKGEALLNSYRASIKTAIIEI